MNLVGFTGRAGAGKDTAAEFIDATPLAFAKPLKDAAKILFNFTDEQMYNHLKKEEIDDRWGKSPREILQWLGTDILRNQINDKFFLINMEERIKRIGNCKNAYPVVVTDVRFDNEAKLIKELGGVIIKIDRPFSEDSGTEHAGHVTEKGISEELIDDVIVNDGSLVKFKEKLLEKFPPDIFLYYSPKCTNCINLIGKITVLGMLSSVKMVNVHELEKVPVTEVPKIIINRKEYDAFQWIFEKSSMKHL